MTPTHLSRSALLAAAFVFTLVGCSSVNLDEQAPAPIVDAPAVTATKTALIRALSRRVDARPDALSTRLRSEQSAVET